MKISLFRDTLEQGSLLIAASRLGRASRGGASRGYVGSGAQVHLFVQSDRHVAWPWAFTPRPRGRDAHASSRHRVPVWTSADSLETYLGCFLRDWLPHLVKKGARDARDPAVLTHQTAKTDTPRSLSFRYARARARERGYFAILRINLTTRENIALYTAKWHDSSVGMSAHHRARMCSE